MRCWNLESLLCTYLNMLLWEVASSFDFLVLFPFVYQSGLSIFACWKLCACRYITLEVSLFWGDAMDAKATQRLQFSTLIHYQEIARKSNGSVKFSRGFREPQKLQALVLQPARPSRNRRRAAPLGVACSYDHLPGSYKNNTILTITIRILFSPIFPVCSKNTYI